MTTHETKTPPNIAAGTSTLNLARSWRPQTFDQIIGQDLSIRMLKNGLYLEKIFPVYLFSGLRGSGKTSTARVFATAINCHNLEAWRKDPAQPHPCMICPSCSSMKKSAHPDFIEIDAASHTGVDDVRQLTESASYLPLVGSKKVYLIDEAHMLSKAAFNAFLKILEEPPPSVLFILATTEVNKIPETVRSRCFQVIFNPIEKDTITKRLADICAKEDIKAEPEALALIARETDGSARDAINLLEKVRFLGEQVTQQDVLASLGKVGEQKLFTLFNHLLEKDAGSMLKYLDTIEYTTLSPTALWYSLIDLTRTLVRLKLAGTDALPAHLYSDIATLKRLAHASSVNRLQAILQLMWNQEEIFVRTHQKHQFFENVLFQICQQVAVKDLDQLIAGLHSASPPIAPTQAVTPQSVPETQEKKNPDPTSVTQEVAQASRNHLETVLDPASKARVTPGNSAALLSQSKTPMDPSSKPVMTQEENPVLPEQQQQQIAQSQHQLTGPWQEIVKQISMLDDPILVSFFRQMVLDTYDKSKKELKIGLARKNSFLLEKLADSKDKWLTIVHKHYPEAKITFIQSNAALLPQPVKKAAPPTQPFTPPKREKRPSGQQNQGFNKTYGGQQRSSFGTKPFVKPEIVDVSDAAQWPKANLIASVFSARIEKLEKTE